MMNQFLRFSVAAWLAALVMARLPAAAASLQIGDPAPPLQVSQWVQGEPVAEFDRQHVYLIEFWATWCVPFRAAIPHLNELAQQFRNQNVVFIGADVSEPDGQAVPAFLQKLGDQEKFAYRVALDDKSRDKNGSMLTQWLQAAGQSGIPITFIVDRQGRLAWIGHPLALQSAVLDQILSGQFDVAAYAQAFTRQQQAQELRQALTLKLHQAFQAKNWDAANDALTNLEKVLPPGTIDPLTRLQILLGRQDYAGACQLAETASDAHPDDPHLQNGLAWILGITKGMDARGLALAEKIATRADLAAHGKDSQVLDTLARVQFMNGHVDAAVASERKAIAAAPDKEKTFLKQILTDYQVGILPDIKP